MKKSIVLILILTLCVITFGCSRPVQSTNNNNTKQNNQEQNESNDNASDSQETTKEATLLINMAFGSETAVYKEYPLNYSGNLTAEMLAKGLSDLTGLDFNITATTTSDGLVVDWSDNSTLLAGLGNREQKDEFFVYDNNSLTWMMLDSLWITLRKNLKVENIYYSMFGGSDLWFEELYPINEFPLDTPYMGSAFYYAHSDVIGDIDDGGNFVDIEDSDTGDRDTDDTSAPSLIDVTTMTGTYMQEDCTEVDNSILTLKYLSDSDSLLLFELDVYQNGQEEIYSGIISVSDWNDARYDSSQYNIDFFFNQNEKDIQISHEGDMRILPDGMYNKVYGDIKVGANTAIALIEQHLPSAATSLNNINSPYALECVGLITENDTGLESYEIIAENINTGDIIARYIAANDLSEVYRADDDMDSPILIFGY